MFENAELIHRYTRADAIRDGVLIDVSATAREAGPRQLPHHSLLPDQHSLVASTKRVFGPSRLTFRPYGVD